MKKEMPAWLWGTIITLIVFALGLVDLLTGFELNFFVFYFLPVSLAAWVLNLYISMIVAILCAMVWIGADFLSGHMYSSHFYAVWNTMARLVSFLAIGGAMSRIRYLLDRERQAADSLRRALSEIKVLETFIPICAQCKKIRDKDGNWQHLEMYIEQHSNTQFSHGYCPECAKNAMAEAGLIDKKEEL
jgi:hypothetical protein